MIIAISGADGSGAGVGLAVADDQHVGRLLQLGLADLLVHSLAAVVDLHAEAGVA